MLEEWELGWDQEFFIGELRVTIAIPIYPGTIIAATDKILV
jgi:hypothetical protein